MYRATTRITLALLIAAAHLAGVPLTPGASRSSQSEIYTCCCPGECHCTGDCCNHGPGRSAQGKLPALRVGAAGVPILEGPRRCGVWQGTLQRSPEQVKLAFANTRGRVVVIADPSNRQRSLPVVLTSIENTLRQSSPRAPPVLAARA